MNYSLTFYIVLMAGWMMALGESVLTGTIEGEAEEYEGIKIEWIRGKQAVLTIFEDGVEKEQVLLYDLKTKEDMHALFQKKGFQKKNEEVIQEDNRIRVVEKQLENEQKLQPMFSTVFMMYGVIAVVSLLFAVMIKIRGGKKQQRRTGSTLPVRI